MGSGRVTVRHPGQRAPRGPVVVPAGRVPRAARVRNYELRARAPRLLRFRDRLEKRPNESMSRMDFLYPKTGHAVKENVTGSDASFHVVHHARAGLRAHTEVGRGSGLCSLYGHRVRDHQTKEMRSHKKTKENAVRTGRLGSRLLLPVRACSSSQKCPRSPPSHFSLRIGVMRQNLPYACLSMGFSKCHSR
jgi:hypothetical protein